MAGPVEHDPDIGILLCTKPFIDGPAFLRGNLVRQQGLNDKSALFDKPQDLANVSLDGMAGEAITRVLDRVAPLQRPFDSHASLVPQVNPVEERHQVSAVFSTRAAEQN